MALADTEIDDQTDLGQDYREPDLPVQGAQPVQPPPAIAPPAPRMVAPPGVSPVAAPAAAPLAPGQAADNTMWRRLQYAVANQPIDKAEQAVATALKFQAVRGYQRDLQDGKSPTEALTRWAPLMFTQPKTANLGQAASLVRAARPPLPARPVNAGGVLYRTNPDGSVTPLTQPRVTAPKANPFDLQAHRQIMADMSATQKLLDADPQGEGADDLRAKLQYLSQQAQEIRNKVAAPPAAPNAAAPAVAAAPAEQAPPVVRSKAQFDALPPGAIYVGKGGKRYRKPYATGTR